MDVSSWTPNDLWVSDGTVWSPSPVGRGWIGYRGHRAGQSAAALGGDARNLVALVGSDVGLLGVDDLDRLEVGDWVVGVEVEGVDSFFAQKTVFPGGSVGWKDGQRRVSVDDIASMGLVSGREVPTTLQVLSVIQTGKSGRYAVVVSGGSGMFSGAPAVLWLEPQGELEVRLSGLAGKGSVKVLNDLEPQDTE